MSSVDDRDAIKFLIETMAPKNKNFGEEFIHRDRGHNNVSETMANNDSADGNTGPDEHTNENHETNGPSNVSDDKTNEFNEFTSDSVINTVDSNFRDSRRSIRRLSKKNSMKVEKRKRPPIGNKIIYGDRDLALPHICSGKPQFLNEVNQKKTLIILYYFCNSHTCAHFSSRTELFQFPTMYEPKFKDDCENWIRRSMETENMMELKRAVEAAQRIGIHNKYNPDLFREAQLVLRAYEANHIPK